MNGDIQRGGIRRNQEPQAAKKEPVKTEIGCNELMNVDLLEVVT